MGGVDKADMFCAIYGTSRKSMKWWHRIFFGLLDRTMGNAYVVYTKMSGQKCSTLDFRRAVAQALITLGKPPKVGRPLAAPSPAQAKRRKNYIFCASYDQATESRRSLAYI